MSLNIVQISLLVLGMFFMNNWAALSNDERQEIYLDTCQISCGLVSNNDEGQECREKFCPNYVNYLLTGYIDIGTKPSFASSHHQEVEKFCAKWLIHLIEQFNWNYHIQLDLNECMRAAGKNKF